MLPSPLSVDEGLESAVANLGGSIYIAGDVSFCAQLLWLLQAVMMLRNMPGFVGLIGDDWFQVRVFVGAPSLTAYCTTPTGAMRDHRTPIRQTEALIESSVYPLAIAIGFDLGDGNGSQYVTGVFISWRCIQFLGLHDVAVGWYVPLPEGTAFKIFVLSTRHMGLVRIENEYLDEVSSEVLLDVRVEGDRACSERGPGLDGRRYVTLPRTSAYGVQLPDFQHPAPGNQQSGVDIRLLGRQGEVRSSDTDLHHATVPCGEVDVFVRTPEWMRARRMITARGRPWRLPNPRFPIAVTPQKRERRGNGERFAQQ